MITTTWISNFGNNMFQFAVLYAVSKKIGIPYTTNGWRGMSTEGTPVGDGKELFNLIKEPDFSQYKETNIFYDSQDQKFNENVFNIKDGTRFYGYFQTDKYFSEYRNEILDLFTFKNNMYDERAKQIINGLNKQIIICMHSREGDSPNSSRSSSEYYKNALDYIISKQNLSLNNIGIILISDNKQSSIFNFLKDTQIKVIFSNEINYVDLCLMKHSNHCITASSSFSWWGAWLNQNNPIIISPFNWMNCNGVTLETFNGCFPVDIKMTAVSHIFMKKNGEII